jgi:hypothetical protein
MYYFFLEPTLARSAQVLPGARGSILLQVPPGDRTGFLIGLALVFGHDQ